MKTNKYIAIILLSLSALFTGCREVETTTEIYADGSCKRIVMVNGDSSDVYEDTPFPVPRSAGWKISFIKNRDQKDSLFTAERTFAKVAEYSKELAADTAYLKIFPKLTKKFRWFNTVYRYEETYKSFLPYHNVPLTDYLSETEIEMLDTKSDSALKALGINDRLEKWEGMNFFMEFFNRFKKIVREMNDPSLTEKMVEDKKDALLTLFDSKDQNDFIVNDSTFSKETMQRFEDLLGTKAVWKLEGQLNQIVTDIMEKLAIRIGISTTDYKSNVIMPGLVIGTNAETVEGARVTWDLDSDKFYLNDYTMWVESRVVNKKIIYASLIIMGIFLVTALTAQIIKRRKV